MIIEFSISNYRSLCKRQLFTMLASSARSKPDNVFSAQLGSSSVRLVKTAAIYGANASGKSNVIRALFEIRKYIVNSGSILIDKPISIYDPFLFNTESSGKPVEFEVLFIGRDKLKYKYKLAFDSEEIVEEALYYYPSGKALEIFKRGKERKDDDDNIHVIKLGKSFNYRKYEVYKKIPFISLFGKAENYHTIISPVYTYFNDLQIWNVTESSWVRLLSNYIKEELQKKENRLLIDPISQLIKDADTQIQSLTLDFEKKISETETIAIDDTKSLRRTVKNEVLYGEHSVFDSFEDDRESKSSHLLPFYNESFGTNKLFAIAGLMVKTLKNGGVIVFDEFDSSLHPLLTSLMLRFFTNNNSGNAQLIFSTHSTYLLNDNLRSDQIWFTDKNQFGETELFSAQDFEGVREDIPFEKWYMGGKFGAIPYLNKLSKIIVDGKEKT